MPLLHLSQATSLSYETPGVVQCEMSQVLVEIHQQKDVAWELRLVTRAGQAMRTCGSGKIAGYNSFVCWWRVGADIVSWMSWTMIMRVTKPEP